MISHKDFERADGVDWAAYLRAQVAAGEKCQQCNSYIPLAGLNLFGGKPKVGPTLCGSCRRLRDECGEEVTHDHLIRCPDCGNTFEPEDYNLDEEQFFYCPDCEAEFEVQVSCTFTSPPRAEKKATSPTLLEDS